MTPYGVVTEWIKAIGDNPQRPGLVSTPRRVQASWSELYMGYDYDDDNISHMLTIFDGEPCDELVLLREIEFYSTCEHHLLPFVGVAHIGYIPDDQRVVGISKLARLLEIYSRRLQIQERICRQVTTALMTHLKPKGAACILEAKHLCISCRGVQKQNSVMVTSSMEGVFRDGTNARQELLRLIGK
jgi:GTP cyclohydrolase IA